MRLTISPQVRYITIHLCNGRIPSEFRNNPGFHKMLITNSLIVYLKIIKYAICVYQCQCINHLLFISQCVYVIRMSFYLSNISIVVDVNVS